eukprot:TRINITY_DN8392_c0_g1_i2.p1 TRINITY_DN8392_c0_g1~~TRINITY_DN8392_c0_g1_i2.p1  ORF type:complete len:414 (+),score=101.21 TRINITY_DN8392_c0_g1_i2:1009-2250(+)
MFLKEIDSLEISAREKLRLLFEQSASAIDSSEVELNEISAKMKAALERFTRTDPSDTKTQSEIESEIEKLAHQPIVLAPPMRLVNISIPQSISLPKPSIEAQNWISFSDLRHRNNISSLQPTASTFTPPKSIAADMSSAKIGVGLTSDSQTFIFRIDNPPCITIYDQDLKATHQISLPSADSITAFTFCHAQKQLMVLTRNAALPTVTRLSIYTLPSTEASSTAELLHSLDLSTFAPDLASDNENNAILAVDWRGHVHLLCKQTNRIHRFGLATTAAAPRPSLMHLSTIELGKSAKNLEWSCIDCDGDRLYLLGSSQDESELQIRALDGSLSESIAIQNQANGLCLLGDGTFALVNKGKDQLLFCNMTGSVLFSVALDGIVHAVQMHEAIYISTVKEDNLCLARHDQIPQVQA